MYRWPQWGCFLNYCTTRPDPSAVVCVPMLDSHCFKRSVQGKERLEEPERKGIWSSFTSAFAFVHPVSLFILVSVILILIIAQAYFSSSHTLASSALSLQLSPHLHVSFIPFLPPPPTPPAVTRAIIERWVRQTKSHRVALERLISGVKCSPGFGGQSGEGKVVGAAVKLNLFPVDWWDLSIPLPGLPRRPLLCEDVGMPAFLAAIYSWNNFYN